MNVDLCVGKKYHQYDLIIIAVNYMQWTFIRDLSPYAGDRMEEIAFEISKQFHGQPPDDSRYVLRIDDT